MKKSGAGDSLVKDGIPTVLVVDEDRSRADSMGAALEHLPMQFQFVYSTEEAYRTLEKLAVDVLLMELHPESLAECFDLMDDVKRQMPACEVILTTAQPSIENCKEAMRRGAFDYLVEPIPTEQIEAVLQQALRQRSDALKPEQALILDSDQGFVYEGILGSSPAMKHVLEVTRRVAKTDIAVLIEGESGTGKELLARAIHMNSPRSHKVFQPVNCAGLSETLLESELFGHTKGAFTGASTDRKGFFEVADGGTLFLDEIGDMPLPMQAKLLRVLEDGLVVPVGSTKPVVVDVRVISATNQNFQESIAAKEFREDLYFRIKGVNITLPSLRERREDIPLLVRYFLEETTREIGSPITGITPAAMRLLESFEWPGNVRQLRHSIRTMVVLCDRKTIDVSDLPPEIAKRPKLLAAPRADSPLNLGGMSLSDLERRAIADTLAQTEGNREKAAKILGIGERTLYRKIKEYDL
jgi:DNA-binding NtrC family response regulator